MTITVAEPALLFAMKLRASRGRRDVLDLDVLVDVCEITSRAAAVELYDGHYPEDPLSGKAKAWLDQHFPAGPTTDKLSGHPRWYLSNADGRTVGTIGTNHSSANSPTVRRFACR